MQRAIVVLGLEQVLLVCPPHGVAGPLGPEPKLQLPEAPVIPNALLGPAGPWLVAASCSALEIKLANVSVDLLTAADCSSVGKIFFDLKT